MYAAAGALIHSGMQWKVEVHFYSTALGSNSRKLFFIDIIDFFFKFLNN